MEDWVLYHESLKCWYEDFEISGVGNTELLKLFRQGAMCFLLKFVGS